MAASRGASGHPPTLHRVHSSDGVDIAYTTIGDGPTLVLMPAAPFSNLVAEWRIPTLRRAFERLAASLRVVQYDARGTGRSQRDVTDLSLEATLDDLDAVLDAVGQARRFSMLGYYSSCMPALAYAARHPERVDALVLFGGASTGWAPQSTAGTQALLSLIERDWDTFVESVTHAWLGWPDSEEGRLAAEWFRTATTPETARATLAAMRAIDLTDVLGRVRCPVLILHRGAAQVIPLEVSEDLVSRLPNATLLVLPGQSASLFFEGADELVRIIADFVHHGRLTSETSPTTERDRPGAKLTERETQVLRLIADGSSNGEIADALGITLNTVERHVANLYRKIDARGRADATAYAIRRGLA
jgi:pimeloyl-ACP methyl ester carboxylesterase/DNA-binding CsgD family transcriptional regulator